MDSRVGDDVDDDGSSDGEDYLLGSGYGCQVWSVVTRDASVEPSRRDGRRRIVEKRFDAAMYTDEVPICARIRQLQQRRADDDDDYDDNDNEGAQARRYVVRFLDIRGSPETLVMELAECTLASAIEHRSRHVADGLRVRSRVMLQVLDAVHFLHERAIVHLDVKPHNVLMFPDAGGGDGMRAKLCDFGLSHDMTRVRELSFPAVATVMFRPPEVMLSNRAYTLREAAALDAWSCGVLWLALVRLNVLGPFANGLGSEYGTLVAMFQLLGTPHRDDAPRTWSLFGDGSAFPFYHGRRVDLDQLANGLLQYDNTRRTTVAVARRTLESFLAITAPLPPVSDASRLTVDTTVAAIVRTGMV